ncbi:unnamed protein product [Toxocara canis]|uniref:SCP domain-containing protein n=1 Tax=Toxocara canis TaxID=6265 RepID=A0A183UVZ1_TOXCA|nr:unnamed protein product [Toxocara canis]
MAQESSNENIFRCNSSSARGLDCPTTQMKREYRETVLKSHNDYRSTVAMGTAQMLGGSYAKRAKNMYKLIYDCDLERQSQEWANRCKYGHSPDDLRNAGENIWATYASYPLTIDQQSMLGATKYWWNELMKYGIIDQSYKYSNAMFSIGHWTQMAWGNTTRVGCGVADCPGMLGTYTTYVVCQYRAPGNYRGRQIYDFGDGCSRDSDCTLFSGSKCEAQTGLCLTP